MTPHPLLLRYLDRLDQCPGQALTDTFVQAITELQRSASPPDTRPLHTLPIAAAGRAVARQVATETANPYHNAQHAAEVLWAGVALFQAENTARAQTRQPALPIDDGLLLLTALVGHDLAHPGTAPGSGPGVGVIEAHSAALVNDILGRYGVPDDRRAQVCHVIESTEPSRAVPAARQAYLDHPIAAHLLAVLAAEADVLASALPWTGVTRGERLAAEWRGQAPELAGKLCSQEGRVGFLQGLAWVSPAAQHLAIAVWVSKDHGQGAERPQAA